MDSEWDEKIESPKIQIKFDVGFWVWILCCKSIAEKSSLLCDDPNVTPEIENKILPIIIESKDTLSALFESGREHCIINLSSISNSRAERTVDSDYEKIQQFKTRGGSVEEGKLELKCESYWSINTNTPLPSGKDDSEGFCMSKPDVRWHYFTSV